MGKVSKAKTAADALHAELCNAIADLAKSVDIAVTQMKLRAQCTAAIANAAKVEHAAELLRATATQPSAKKTERVSIVPPVRDAQKSRREKNARQAKLRSRDVPPNKAVGDLHAACKRPTTTQPQDKKRDQPAESAIAMRILELHDRFGGLIK